MRLLWMVKVDSRSKKGKKRFVRYLEENGEKEWACNCPAFLFRNPDKKDCYHIRITKEEWLDGHQNKIKS